MTLTATRPMCLLAPAGLLLSFSTLLGDEQAGANQRGTAAYEKHDYALAVACYSEAIQRDSQNAAIYYNRALAYKALGDLDKAIADYSEAVHLNPELMEGYYNRGLAYHIKGDYNKAIADAEVVIRLNPTFAQAYNNRGSAYEAKGDYAKAVADYDESIHMDPNYAVGRNNLAWLLGTCAETNFRDGNKAVKYATKACEVSGWKTPVFMDTLAAGYAEAGDFAQAVKWETKYLQTPNLNEESAAKARKRLVLYQAHKPYHEEKPQR